MKYFLQPWVMSLTSQPGKAEGRTMVAACGARTADPCRTQKNPFLPTLQCSVRVEGHLNSVKRSNFCLSACTEGKTQLSLNGRAELDPLAREVPAAQGFVPGSRPHGSDTAQLEGTETGPPLLPAVHRSHGSSQNTGTTLAKAQGSRV